MIKNNKEKIFELKIEEDDEISGVDSISLVDEPAIEFNWVAFRNEKEHEFHIPDGEDNNYSARLIEKAELEEDLINEGYEFVSYVEEDFVSTAPNKDSSEDTDFYRVRYKYALSPNISQSPIIATTRAFCKDLLMKNYVWREEDIEAITNDFGDSARKWRGGYNCRHRWQKLLYKRTGDIINKASITKDRILGPLDIAIGMIPDFDQPNTVTNKTLNNPSPSTKKNLGLKKEEMGYDVGGITPYVDQIGKKKKKKDGDLISKSLTDPTTYPVEFDYLQSENFADSYNDYPESASNNACKVLRWRDEHGDEVNGMTQVGWTRANQLCNKENISQDTISRMAAFARHRKNAEVSPEYKSTPWKDAGYVAWLGWGGTTGIEWASKKLESIKRQKMSKQHFQTDDEKRIVLGPCMVPDQKIFRKDKFGGTYYVYFTADTIRKIQEKYFKNKFIDNNDLMHDGNAASDVFVIESWIKESQNDKSTDYGYGELPIGTWFVAMKVNNDMVWEQIKAGKLNGFSVSGFFEEQAMFNKEELFLRQVAEILKKY